MPHGGITYLDGQVEARLLSQLQATGMLPGRAHRNLEPQELIRIAVEKGDGVVTSTGSLSVRTGKYTGRSPGDRYIVYDGTTRDTVDWGKVNHKFDPGRFAEIFERMKGFVKGKELYVFDGFVGADPENRIAVRVINDHAWQSLFARQLFIRPSPEELEAHKPEFTILCVNDFEAVPERDGTNSNVFIVIDLTRKTVLIGGTRYAGEIKKSMFSVMNYVLPAKGVLPMHCSANIGRGGDTALFFGLSGTGKTTLSADPDRMLIGDDEHGWSEKGSFNFEGGCYAKCINLSEEAEPQIWNAVKSGAVLENVVVDGETSRPNFDDGSLTENTRAAYPLEYIPGAVIPSMGTNPKVVVFLTADAMGVLPPVSRLTKEGAMYHFMSGYTSKLTGTERGIKEPQAVFSECFAAPFMPRPAAVYARMLGEKIGKHDAAVYLINTGWSGGPYGVGRRIKIKYSRAMVTAVLTGALSGVEYRHDGLFNLDVPVECPGVPQGILDPRRQWEDGEAYDAAARDLARMFAENFEKFKETPDEIQRAGPSAP
ncbi:phosphoenolpyruvate carboxykinase (ATP) [Cenarchaeum symbiosum A]|uniref:Phosphoenolpyruvate carboxykinase (ATP) n=1 Tax=Cenarchaeum symbiosum (strain A) TaxID=414004 RepID=A0RUF6_CENSY|nr:phosphoenolpyruvate carboxykinase (ATP) [Cenarchaeum symbiosum A]